MSDNESLADIPLPDDPDELWPDDPAEREAFRVDDDPKAMWAMRKLYECHESIEATRATAEMERERLRKELAAVNRWEEIETGPDRRFAEFLHAQLYGYGKRQRRDEGRKSVSTPYGKVTTQALQDRIDVEDLEEFTSWALENGRLDLLKIDVRKAPVKTAVLTDGEILPGVKAQRSGPDEFTVHVTPKLAG